MTGDCHPPSPLDILRPNHGRHSRIRKKKKKKKRKKRKLLPRRICSKGHRAIVGQSLGHNTPQSKPRWPGIHATAPLYITGYLMMILGPDAELNASQILLGLPASCC